MKLTIPWLKGLFIAVVLSFLSIKKAHADVQECFVEPAHQVICEGGTATFTVRPSSLLFPPYFYRWFYNGEQLTAFDGKASITVSQAGLYTAGLTDGDGIEFFCNGVLEVVPKPVVAVATPGAICEGGSVTLTATATPNNPAFTYLWNTGATTASITVSPTTTTTYTVTLSSADGKCTDSKSVTVTVNPKPTVTVNSGSVCAGGSFTLTASGTTGSYLWSNGATTQSITVSPTDTTTYTVTVTTAANCSASASGTVTVTAKPIITVVGCRPICAGETVTLTASGANPGDSYLWSNGATTQSITVTPAVDTAYTVTVTSGGSPGGSPCPPGLPTGATFSVTAGWNADATGEPSYLDVTLSGAGFLNGLYDGWCIDTDHTLSASLGYPSLVYCSYGSSIPSGLIEFPENLDSANYVINQHYPGKLALDGQPFTYADVQKALWVLLDDNSDSDTGGVAASAAHVDQIVAEAVTIGNNFTPACGQLVALILVPQTADPHQLVLIPYPVACCSAQASCTVTVNPKPTVTVNNATICVGGTATLTATGSADVTGYLWNNGETTQSISVSPASSGTYTVTVKTATDCEASASGNVTVNPKPTVSVNNATICIGGTATLTANGSADVVSYLWSNGATTQSITVSPASTETYTVTVKTTPGCEASASGTVTVNPKPTVSVNNASVCVGGTTTLTASGSADVVSYLWNNGATTQSITVTPGSTTTYTVTVKTTPGCEASASGTVTVNPKPTVSVNNASVCIGGTTTLTASGSADVVSYLWNNGATTQSITVTPGSTTTYTVTVKTTPGCEASASGTVTVNPKPTVSVNNASVCIGGTTTLTASGSANVVSYLWNTGATTQSITVTPGSTTTYTVTVKTAAGCEASASGTVTVNPKPTVSVNNASVCIGGTTTLTASGSANVVSYLWNTGATTQSITVTPGSTTTYTVTVKTAAGCEASASGTVTVNPKPTVSVNNASVCIGGSATLTATGSADVVSYLWNTGATTQSITVTPGSTTTYTVTVKTTGGCEASASGTVTVNPKPTVSVNSVGICVGGSATLTATGTSGVTYLWSNGATTQSITINPAVTTSYTVTVKTSAGCEASASGTVTVTPPPTVTVNSGSICIGETITLTATASPGVTFLWNTGATTPSITVSPTSTTVYTVTVKNAAGCTGSGSGTVTVGAGVCEGGSVDLTGGTTSGSPNTRTYTTSNGVGVKVTGWSRTSAGVWAPATVGSYSGGLGVTDSSESGADPTHTLDNVDRNNYLLFEFSQPVVVKAATIGYVVTDSDLSLRVGTFSDPYNNHLTLTDSVFGNFSYGEENAGGNINRTATFSSSVPAGNAVIIAASLTDKAAADQVKVKLLEICKPVCFQPVKVGDFVWKDLDKDGIQEAGEPGINGVVLTLTGTTAGGSSVTQTTTTSGNGGYLFGGLQPGTYTVTVNAANFAAGGALNGYSASPTLVGANRAVDSNNSPSGTTPAALPGGSSDLTLDFGFYPTPPPPPCVETTFAFDGSSSTDGADGNTRTYTVNGISVRASAWSRDKSTGVWAKGWLGAYGGGLGVTDTSEGTGSDNSHTVDNMGRDNFVLFEFSQKVTVNSAYLGYVVNDSDILTGIGTVPNAFTSSQTLSDGYFADFDLEENDTTSSAPRLAQFNANGTEGNILVIAASPYDESPDDMFKIQKLTVCAPTTPPPPQECVPTSFAFDSNSALDGTDGNIRTYSVNGIGVKASAWSRTSGGVWAKGWLGAYSGGLGVTDTGEGDGSGNKHTVDNIDRVNYVLFEFSQSVIVDRAYLGYVVADSDISAWVGNASNPYVNHLTLTDSLVSGFGAREDNDTTSSDPRWADINTAGKVGNVLLIAASLADSTPDDEFKIQKLDICAGTPPASPSPWTSKDIGVCTKTGTDSALGGVFTVKGSGDDIWNSADGFHYVYQTSSGDCMMVARVVGVQNVDPWTKAGVMIRESVNADSKHASVFLTPGNGIAFQYRTATGGASVTAAGPAVGAPYYVAIVRSGNTYSGYSSPNGTTWTQVGSSATFTMNSAAKIGLAVTSHNNASLATATFDNVSPTP